MANSSRRWPSIVWSADRQRASVSRAVDRGTLRRLAPGLYTGEVDSEPAEVVRRHLWEIIGHELPGAVISDRSARAAGPVGGSLFVVHPRTRPLVLPGVVVRPRSGPAAVPGDTPLPFGIHLASATRTMLESLARPGGNRLERIEVEHWLDQLAAPDAERRLNQIRDRAREVAPMLRASTAAAELERLIAAALSTGDLRVVTTTRLAARSAGEPIDQRRIVGLERLVADLADRAPSSVFDLPADATRRSLLPFYEAYFSNFIEGTEFTLDEAASIVFDREVPAARPEDAHDVIGTYAIVGDPVSRRRTATDADEFVGLLLEHHARVMSGRLDKRPGEFKHLANRAGSTEFVSPELVEGTLRAGFAIGKQLSSPMHRAIFMMFLVTEVHPFLDGNGRVARIAMNAELTRGGQCRIIVPTVIRLDYTNALKAASHQDAFGQMIAVLEYAQRFTGRLDFSDRTTAERDLQRTNALRDPYEAEQAGVKLTLP